MIKKTDFAKLAKGYGAIIKHSMSLAPKIFEHGAKKIIKIKQNKATSVEDEAILKMANGWIVNNNRNLDALMPHKDWRISLPDDLKQDGQYLLICNHQSWVDTSVIQYISENRLPLTRFFAKHELMYIPIVGQTFYLLDFPMMKRHSKQKIKQNPSLAGRDLIEAKRACHLLKDKPFVLLNYLEGTRFSQAKHHQQSSPYRHLLKPKAGGFALAIELLGGQIDGILDMTIVYPNGAPAYGDLWLGNVDKLAVDIEHLSMPQALFAQIKAGQYDRDDKVKAQFYDYLDELWQQKDDKIVRMMGWFE